MKTNEVIYTEDFEICGMFEEPEDALDYLESIGWDYVGSDPYDAFGAFIATGTLGSAKVLNASDVAFVSKSGEKKSFFIVEIQLGA